MKNRQIFYSYSLDGKNESSEFKYCPKCGTECVGSQRVSGARPACRRCGYVIHRNPAPGVVVLIEDKGRVLLGRRVSGSYQPGKWCLPGGFIEFEENFLAAAHREVREETGLEIKLESIINVVSNYLTPHLHTLVVVMLARYQGGKLSAGDDLSTLDWFSAHQPLPEMAFPADKYIIERFFSGNLEGIPVDPQQGLGDTESVW